MAWGKGKAEKGQRGKLGHSNKEDWGYHDEEKAIAKKHRRLEEKQIILNETSKIAVDIREHLNTLIRILYKHKFNFEIHEFDSGAAIMDVWIKSDFYCIQMSENKFGWTKITEESGFSSIPASGYMKWIEFKNQFDEIIKST